MHRLTNRIFTLAFALAALVLFMAGVADAKLAGNHNQTLLRP